MTDRDEQHSPETKEEIARLFRAFRDKHNLTQDTLAKRLAVSRTSITQADKGNIFGKVLKALDREFEEDAVNLRGALAHFEKYGKDAEGPTDEEDTATTRWIGLIPPSGSRDYTSLDDLAMTISGVNLQVRFERMFPLGYDRGRKWLGRGTSFDGGRELRFEFEPEHKEGRLRDSSGVMLLLHKYDELTRTAYYDGQYLRRYNGPAGDQVDARTCRLYHADTFPTAYMPWVAALDLDNTLFQGWSLLEWSSSVRAAGLDGIESLQKKLSNMRLQYEAGKVSHDQFSVDAVHEYSTFRRTVNVGDLRASMAGFAADSHQNSRFFPFAHELISTLRSMFIAPTIITGSPSELARELGSAIGVTDIYGWTENGEDGHVGESLTGTAEGKKNQVNRLIAPRNWSLQFVAGDSLSDVPVLQWAPMRMAAKSLLKAQPELQAPNGPATLGFDKNTSAVEVRQWLETHLPNRLRELYMRQQQLPAATPADFH